MIKKIFTLILITYTSVGFTRELAFSFDDGVNPETTPDAKIINSAILGQLKDKKIKAIIYPSLIKTGTQGGLDLVAEWGRQGHRVGNHSESHLSLNKKEVVLNDYLKSMEHADKALNKLPGWVPRYRYPFLKAGDTVEKRDGVRNWLTKHSYQSGEVTIDASDWYYNQLYKKYDAANDVVSLGKLRRAYLAHLLDRAAYYDKLALEAVNYSPKHVILLHVNAINAAYIGDVIDAFRKKGWKLVDSDTAYADPFYQTQVNILPAGESLIWSIAKQKGVENLRYPAEDAPYEKKHLESYGLIVAP